MKGRWSIVKEEYPEFLALYAHAIESGDALTFTELHDAISPVVIDIDMKFPIDLGVIRKYTETDVANIVQMYTDQISHYFDVGSDDIVAYVLEKESPVKQDGYIKDGIHIIYPKIVSKPDVQYEIRNNVIELCKSKQLLAHLKFQNKLEDVFDEAVIKRSGWMMYGSAKNNNFAYKLTKVFDHTCTEHRPQALSTLEIIKLFSIRNHETAATVKVPIRRAALPAATERVQRSHEKTDISRKEDCELAAKLVWLLDAERANGRATWIDVGMALYHTDRNLIDVWIQFSKQSSKYGDGECERQWKSFAKYRGATLTIASLNLWAKIDSPTEYYNLKRDSLQGLLMSSLECTHFDAAKLMHAKFQYQYVCSSLRYGTWYEFRNHRWNEMQKACELRKVLSTDVAAEYYRISSQFRNQSMENPEDASLKEKHKMCDRMLKNVKDRRFKDQVVKDCEDLFDDTAFENKLNSYTMLLGFNNGIYDLEKMVFRDGRPDDFVSFSTGIDYVPFDDEDPDSVEMVEFLKQVLPDPDVRRYVLKLISSFLSGKTGDQKFHIWTGCGSNGKSKLLDLVEYSFGDYAQKLPVTVLTHKRGGASAANPEIAKTKGKRFVSFQEPEKEDKIHVGYMKELTGGDTIMARAMYKEPVEFKPQFKMILACNDLPSIPSTDNGTWRRLRVVDFPSKFVEQPDPNNENEFKMDTGIPEKLWRWRECFMGLLVAMYARYKEDGLQEPECVTKYTNQYKRLSDKFLDFVDENIDITENSNDKVSLGESYIRYRVWYRQANTHDAPPRQQFRVEMEKRYGEYNNRTGWRGMLLREISDELE